MKIEPAFDDFSRAHDGGRPQLVWTRLIDDLETPVSAYLKIARDRPYAFLFESVEGGAWRGRYSLIVLDPDLVWQCRDGRARVSAGADIAAAVFHEQAGDALDSLRDLVAASRLDVPPGLPPMAAGVFGVIGYDMVRLVEHLPDTPRDPLDLPDAIMIRPSVVAIFDAIAQEIVLVTTVRPSEIDAAAAFADAKARLEGVCADLGRPLKVKGLSSPPATPAPLTSAIDQGTYGALVERAKRYIEAGDIFQVVPSHRFTAPFEGQPFALYRSLRRTNPSPFLYFLNFPDFQLVGSSPEILVRLRDRKITIRPIAGTRRRGDTPEEDASLERELLADEKERAEHLMLLDLGRNDVGRVAMLRDDGRNDLDDESGPAPPRVRVTESFVIERYSHVMHIVSNVEGDAPEGLDPVDVLMAALPAGTLSGAPKVRAMELIDQLEPTKRGIYGGACGYLSFGGEMDLAIAIRTGVLKDGMLHVQAAAGIVADSVPEMEWQETENKARAVLRAAEQVQDGLDGEI